MGCCYDGCFACLSCDFLDVEGDDFGCVAVECAAEFVGDPPLFFAVYELGDFVAVFLSVA